MNVLFVEDDPLNRRVVRDMLTVVGADMAEAPDAETGLSMIDGNDYQIVLMDLRMPGMDGLEAIQRIRARPDGKNAVPIIVVTADMAIDLHEQCISHGADEVIRKPIGMESLLDAMGRMIARGADDVVLV